MICDLLSNQIRPHDYLTITSGTEFEIALSMLKQSILTSVILTLVVCAVAQNETSTQPIPEKYNGFGLPNTKFKKVLSNSALNPPAKQVEIKKVNSALTPSLSTSPKKVEPLFKLGLDLSTTYGLQSEKQSDGTQSQSLYYEANPKVQYGIYSLVGAIYYYQNLQSPQYDEWQDSTLTFTRSAWNAGDYVLLVPYLIYGAPLSKSSREKSFITSTAGTSVNVGLNTANLGLPQLILNYSFNYTKMFTSSDLNSKKEPNVDYRLRQRFNFGYSFTETFSFKTRFQFDSAYAKDNFVTNAFLHYQQFDYRTNDYVTIYAGHANSNGLYNPETYENNLKFYDGKSSEFFLGFTLSFKNY